MHIIIQIILYILHNYSKKTRQTYIKHEMHYRNIFKRQLDKVQNDILSTYSVPPHNSPIKDVCFAFCVLKEERRGKHS